MKFRVSIWCLLVSIHLASVARCQEFVTDPVEPGGKVDSAELWQLEKKKFKKGLKVLNNKGELVEMTADEIPPPGFARRGFRTDVHFQLYTKKNPATPRELLADKKSGKPPDLGFFDHQKPTYFITHGWMNTGDSSSCTLIRKALLKNNDVNVVVVDWGSMAISTYGWAVCHLKNVSRSVVAMIKFLKEKAHLDPGNVTFVGHSLGAHVMGIAGHMLHGTIKTIFGLDPALPLFMFAQPGDRISKTDAKHVQIIHTCAGLLGFAKAIGTSDFYPDGGSMQLSCPLDVSCACSHTRAYEYYARSLLPKNLLQAWQCRDQENFLSGRCKRSKNSKLAKMGGLTVDPGLQGSFYLWMDSKTGNIIWDMGSMILNTWQELFS